MSTTARTTTAGERRYDVRLRRGDGSVYTRSFRTRREAETYERAELSARDHGTWTDPRAGRITLTDYAEDWLKGRTRQRQAARPPHRRGLPLPPGRLPTPRLRQPGHRLDPRP
jgi:hypothetical protein